MEANSTCTLPPAGTTEAKKKSEEAAGHCVTDALRESGHLQATHTGSKSSVSNAQSSFLAVALD